ncbi:penicillin-binding protein [Tannerella sp. oral taxon 808]|nr:penicillin-binding protein [Tannerella sp. oral taxon 808]
MSEQEKDRANEQAARKAKDGQILTRYFIIVVLLAPLAAGILFLTFKTAFIEKAKWNKVAESRKKPNRLVNPTRGNIYSADGKLMATSVPRYYLYVDFKAAGFHAPSPRGGKKEINIDTFMRSRENGIDSLAFYLSRKLKNRTAAGYRAYLLRGLRQGSRQYPLYENRLSYADVKEIRDYPFFRFGRNVSGLYEREMVQRQKMFGSLASRTIGDIYNEIETGGLSKGKNGLELRYDTLLRGKPGLNSIVRVGGRWTNVVEEEPTAGLDIRTTIDLQIQDLTEKALVDKLQETDAASGVAVVMEVKTGEVKAISNMERIRPGVYAELRNHALADELEPGSTFKIASMMVALEDGVCTPESSIDVGNGVYKFNGRTIRDHNAQSGGYGTITAAQSIWYSSNVGIAKIILRGYSDNPRKFVDGLHRTGIDADLHLDIAGAGHAKIRRPGDLQWSRMTLPWMSFGYEVQIPPINTLAFFNAIANDGRLMRPMFVKSIMRAGKELRVYEPEVIVPEICSKRTLKAVQEMMYNVVNYKDPAGRRDGTGKPARSSVVTIAGKTGTAQIAASKAAHNLSFCGYFPYEKPQYSCIVVISRPRRGVASGGMMAGTVFKEIAEKVYSNQIRYDLRAMKPEPGRSLMPPIKNGETRSAQALIKQFDIRTTPKRVDADFTAFRRNATSDTVNMRKLTIREGMMPYVIGMGAKDAIYAIERCGFRVNLVGRGRVISQSVPSGQTVSRGETVHILLN